MIVVMHCQLLPCDSSHVTSGMHVWALELPTTALHLMPRWKDCFSLSTTVTGVVCCMLLWAYWPGHPAGQMHRPWGCEASQFHATAAVPGSTESS